MKNGLRKHEGCPDKTESQDDKQQENTKAKVWILLCQSKKP